MADAYLAVCPDCGNTVNVKTEWVGREAMCPKCRMPLVLSGSSVVGTEGPRIQTNESSPSPDEPRRQISLVWSKLAVPRRRLLLACLIVLAVFVLLRMGLFLLVGRYEPATDAEALAEVRSVILRHVGQPIEFENDWKISWIRSSQMRRAEGHVSRYGKRHKCTVLIHERGRTDGQMNWDTEGMVMDGVIVFHRITQ